ncbi:Alpha/Beta hydrolase protein [Cladochytrium replicatum]|nr:Alpha/Beta hydrolase protein [Cladochytrium replicatum]
MPPFRKNACSLLAVLLVSHAIFVNAGNWTMPWLDGILPNRATFSVPNIIYFPSSVRPTILSSFSGYIDVSPTNNRSIGHNMYFWYFPAAANATAKKQLILYLNGGPGCSSLVGLFRVNGPVMPNPLATGGQFVSNPSSWHLNADVVYVDQPIFTGYSYSVRGSFARNQNQVSNLMYNFLVRFLYIFSELQDHQLILSGESYAGQYIPYLARNIIFRNTFARWFQNNGLINLAAIGIGAPFIDSASLYTSYLPFALQYGLDFGNATAQSLYRNRTNECNNAMTQVGDLTYIAECTRIMDAITSTVSSLRNGSCFNYYQIRRGLQSPIICVDTVTTQDYNTYLLVNDGVFRNAVHTPYVAGSKVPQFFQTCSTNVWNNMSPDGSRPSKDTLKRLLSTGIPVHIWSGTEDFIINYMGLESAIEKMWTNGQLQNSLTNWVVGGQVVGRTAKVNGLTYYRISNVGHLTVGEAPTIGNQIVQNLLADAAAFHAAKR